VWGLGTGLAVVRESRVARTRSGRSGVDDK
jgi:hypothetical protein